MDENSKEPFSNTLEETLELAKPEKRKAQEKKKNVLAY